MSETGETIDVSIGSDLLSLDLVQTVTDCVTRFAGFDPDCAHWIGMSVRESVTNAIQHGNRLDHSKKVDIHFKIASDRLEITVRDQGKGFPVERLPNPLDPENLLKPSGRGIFYIRSFMDEVEFRQLSQGMEVHMIKKFNQN